MCLESYYPDKQLNKLLTTQLGACIQSQNKYTLSLVKVSQVVYNYTLMESTPNQL